MSVPINRFQACPLIAAGLAGVIGLPATAGLKNPGFESPGNRVPNNFNIIPG